MKNLYLFETFFGVTLINGMLIPQELQVEKNIPIKIDNNQNYSPDYQRMRDIFSEKIIPKKISFISTGSMPIRFPNWMNK